MEDGNANLAVGVDVGVEHRRCESHDRRGVGEVVREIKNSLEEAALIHGVGWTDDEHVPLEDVVVGHADAE